MKLRSNPLLMVLFFGVADGDSKLLAQSARVLAATGNMTTAHTATLIPNGRVLIAGGTDIPGPIAPALVSAEIYDPPSATFLAVANMTAARLEHTATLLPDGKVLIAGGFGGFTSQQLSGVTPSADIPAAGNHHLDRPLRYWGCDKGLRRISAKVAFACPPALQTGRDLEKRNWSPEAQRIFHRGTASWRNGVLRLQPLVYVPLVLEVGDRSSSPAVRRVRIAKRS